MKPHEINKRICDALGVDSSDAIEVIIRLEPGNFPKVVTTKFLPDENDFVEIIGSLAFDHEAEDEGEFL